MHVQDASGIRNDEKKSASERIHQLEQDLCCLRMPSHSNDPKGVVILHECLCNVLILERNNCGLLIAEKPQRRCLGNQVPGVLHVSVRQE